MKILKTETWNFLNKELEELKIQKLQLEEDANLLKQKVIVVDKVKEVITPGPSSARDLPKTGFAIIKEQVDVLEPDFSMDVIPVIRKLTKVNSSVSQAFNDIIALSNTGHKIYFDPGVGPEQIDKMRKFLQESGKKWHVGAGGIHGIVNKMLRQGMIGGALSNEWVPNMELDNIDEIRFLNPESIRFVVDKNKSKYHPYQKLRNKTFAEPGKNLRRLNTNQFCYLALNGDEDVPYGSPPYLAALDAIGTQVTMKANIKHIMETLGLMGYSEARIAKPNKNNGESDADYLARLNSLLAQYKDRMKSATHDGTIVGFLEDHEFEFHATAKNAQGVTDLYEQNQLEIASGLKYDSAFMGRPGSTETLVTILFTKMIAQLKNIQILIGENLEFGYRLALTLAGFKFNEIRVEFNRSTITDDLKYQQAQEILIRNMMALFDQGVISQQQFADTLGYIKPDQPEPRVTRDPIEIGDAKKKQDQEKKKDVNDKKNRDKNNPAGTTRKPRSAAASAGLNGHHIELN